MFLPEIVVADTLLSACKLLAEIVPSVSISSTCIVAAVRLLNIAPAVERMLAADNVVRLLTGINEPDTAVLAKKSKSVTCDLRIVRSAWCCVTLLEATLALAKVPDVICDVAIAIADWCWVTLDSDILASANVPEVILLVASDGI